MPDPPTAADVSKVGGMNIFWVLFTMISATVLHPLGTAPGFSPRFTHYARILPLTSALDALAMYVSCLRSWRTTGTPFHLAARAIAIHRLQANLPASEDLRLGSFRMRSLADASRASAADHHEEEEAGDEATQHGGAAHNRLHLALAQLYLDSIPRAMANAGIVVSYTKICGFRGVPYSQALATACFATWTTMEVFLVLAFGFRSPKEALSSAAGARTRPRRTRYRVLILTIARMLVLAQVIALLAVFIRAAIDVRPGGEANLPEPPDTPSRVGDQ